MHWASGDYRRTLLELWTYNTKCISNPKNPLELLRDSCHSLRGPPRQVHAVRLGLHCWTQTDVWDSLELGIRDDPRVGCKIPDQSHRRSSRLEDWNQNYTKQCYRGITHLQVGRQALVKTRRMAELWQNRCGTIVDGGQVFRLLRDV